MLKVKLSYAALMVSVALGVNSCGGDSSDEPTVSVPFSETTVSVPFSLGISDAPVDKTDEVVITIDQVILTPFDGDDDGDDEDDDDDDDDKRETIVIDYFDGEDTISVNLVDYTGNEQLAIVNESDDIEVPIGHYKMTIVVINDTSYVSYENNEAEYDLKVPSSKLKVGSFEMLLEATETPVGPAYTVEFDLRKSLVMRGKDPEKNGFILRPHGVRVVVNTNSGHIEGDVNLFEEQGIVELDAECTGPDHVVYLFEGDQTADGIELVDFDNPEDVPEGVVQAFASTLVKLDEDEDDDDVSIDVDEYEYEFGFVPTGDGSEKDYTLVFACDDTFDDKGIVTPKPKGQKSLVTVSAGEEAELNFPIGYKGDDDGEDD